MAGSNDLIDKLSSLPKWQMVGIAVGVLLAVGIPAVYFGFGMNKKPKETQQYEKVLIDIPDAIAYEDNRNRMQTYDDVALEERRSAPSRSYWDDLSQDIVSNSKAKADDPSDPEYLDPSVYSPAEIKLIRAGFKTKAQIDREHEEAAREVRELAERSAQASRKLTPEQKDSIYWAKVEKSMEMTARIARKYQDVPEDAEEDNTAARPKEEEPQESERKIDLGSNTSALPANAMGESDIITSLVGDGDDDVVHYSGTPRSKPVKATFLKNETISSGQRVIIRLMQELTLSDGTVIPANTHITGTCSISKRLKIDVKMLHYNGRMFPTDISVYDNDGTEGIYCPTAEEAQKVAKKLKKAASSATQSVMSTMGTLVTGNPLMGRLATQGMNGVSSAIQEDGSVSITVSAGYEFYVFENVRDKTR